MKPFVSREILRTVVDWTRFGYEMEFGLIGGGNRAKNETKVGSMNLLCGWQFNRTIFVLAC